LRLEIAVCNGILPWTRPCHIATKPEIKLSAAVVRKRVMCYEAGMTKEQVKEILDKVLTWAPDEQERVARFVREVERRRGDDDITDEEWKVIEQRAARRDLASDEEVEEVFRRYRSA
jgi:hypothetical protein